MARAEKLDLYKTHKDDYSKTKKPRLLTIKPAQYLTIVGKGEPGGDGFVARVGALYGMAFTIKMARKFAGNDYAVCKLEGLWWGKRKDGQFFSEPKSQWNWQLLIRVPDFINEVDRKNAVGALLAKGKDPAVSEVKLETIDEGLCVQMLHVGPYDQESRTIAQMLGHAEAEGYAFHGKHHEIYLSDPRRVAPERLQTILRHPVR
jgi:hypothetical protein